MIFISASRELLDRLDVHDRQHRVAVDVGVAQRDAVAGLDADASVTMFTIGTGQNRPLSVCHSVLATTSASALFM